MLAVRTLCAVAIAATLHACAPLPMREPRAARSSVGCMQAALARSDFDSHADDAAHCMAAGLIALRCSRTEAWLAGIGKELRDLVGPGDAEWRDLQADARGIRCARSTMDDKGLLECCSDAIGRRSEAD